MPPMPSPAPTPAPASPMEIYQAALARYQAANPYATATPVSSAGAPQAPNALQQGAQTAMQIYAKRELAKQLMGSSASTAAPELLSATRLGADAATGTASSAAPEILSATRIPGATPGVGVMPYVGGVGAALGAYGIHKGIEANDPKMSGLSGAGMGLGLGAMAPLVGLGPLGWGAMGLMALGGGGLGVGLQQLLGRESTRDIAKKHTKSLLGASSDSAYQNYVNAMRGQYNSAPSDPSKPFAGKYANWDAYKKGGLEAGDLTGVYGNIKTFGTDWTKINQDQRKAVTQGLIDAGLYNSKKGEVEVTDADKAKQIYKEKIDAYLKEAKK